MKKIFGIYVILTEPKVGYQAATQAAVDEEVPYLQLRIKDHPQKEFLKIARDLRVITQGSPTRLIINDDLEIAMETNADGIHLGQQDLSLNQARQRWDKPGKIFGLSTHNEESEQEARKLKPDYIGVGPIFPTPTKKDHDPALGVTRAGEIIRTSPLPCVAIGGVDKNTLPALVAAGVVNFACVRPVCSTDKPRQAIRELIELWRELTDIQ